MAMPITPVAPRPMAPASAVTSPSFATTMGTVPSPMAAAARSKTVCTSFRTSFSLGTLINSEDTIGALPMNTPADDTPMPSTRGILDAAVRKAVTISS